MKHKPKQLLQFTQAQAFLFLENHFFWVKSSSSRREIRPIFPGTAFSELYTRILKEVLWNECDVGGGDENKEAVGKAKSASQNESE